ncbi:hypothetical protein KFE96_05770 [Kordiimonas sp. SCSIO 12603]|uniref:hypothetical protein n=1 Tax=Kordiimonas sp. SCSIO 12603 TaxID=2829596 RepID=UPI00210678BE|nr:hypothetical protein [Kordiimonas sp. SCSIO 12603]UTW59811.1 hypothetical protein KFE96_05770 [Kordiimonas sp. SCSIO 12603]
MEALTEFERAVLEGLIGACPEQAKVLEGQLSTVEVVDRSREPFSIVISLVVAEDAPKLEKDVIVFPIQFFSVENMKDDVRVEVHTRDGYLSYIRIFSFGEEVVFPLIKGKES